MKLKFQSKLSLTYMLLLIVVQLGSLYALYWVMAHFHSTHFLSGFALVALCSTTLLIMASLFLFRQLLHKLSASEQSLAFQAKHDAITGLPNRSYFFDYVENRLTHLATAQQPFAIMAIDIDRFPQINQALGYVVGDRLLNHVAERLKISLPHAELMGRLAGNVFIVLLPNVTPKHVKHEAHFILELFATPFSVYTVQIDLDVHMGFSFYPNNALTATELIQRADLALYAARHLPERYEIYQEQKDRKKQNKLSLMSELRDGISQNEFALFYQPKVNLITGLSQQAEALVRWLHPSKGFMDPDDFIPLAEETGHIKRLTFWVLEQGIAQLSYWHQNNIPLGLSLNLSVKDLLNQKLPSHLEGLIKEHQVPAHLLTLEITESAFMREPDIAIHAAHRLKQLGVRLSIDDFGTGYSSLRYLHQLPVDELKIDKSFIIEIMQSNRVAQIVKSTIRMGQSIGMNIVAEGLADIDTFKVLKHFGCNLGQGYYFSKPLSQTEFLIWLKTSPWGMASTV